MKHPVKIVNCLCVKRAKDPVAFGVLENLQLLSSMEAATCCVDGYPVLICYPHPGVEHLVVRTKEVVSHDYDHYVRELSPLLDGVDLINIVNWHEGTSAPDRIFCLHTTGDVPSGVFGPVSPLLTGALARSIEAARKSTGLDDYTTLTEATHWSGVFFGSEPERILELPIPVLDVEIGSSPAAWGDWAAARVLARGILDLSLHVVDGLPTIVYFGGVHFEASLRDAVLGNQPAFDLNPSHILPNQWLVSGGYDQPMARERLVNCLRSIQGDISALVVHNSLKGTYKAAVRSLADEFEVPVMTHRQLRRLTLEELSAGR